MPNGTRRIRLVPGSLSGNRISIHNLSLVRNGFLSTKRKTLSESDILNLHNVIKEGDRFKTSNMESYLELSPELLLKTHIDIRRLSLLILFFLIASWMILSAKADDWIHAVNLLSSGIDRLKQYCIANRVFLFYMFSCIIIIFGYELFNLPITADDDWYLLSNFEYLENSMPGAYSTLTYHTLSDVFICHGRWANSIILKLFPGYCPVLSFLWCLGSLSFIFIFLTEKLHLPREIRYLLFPLFLGHPVFYLTLMFFSQNSFIGVVAPIAFLAAVYWTRCRGWMFLMVVFAGFFALSSYQSLILFFPLWFLLQKMSDSLDSPIQYKRSFIELLKLCGFCLLVLLGYVLALKYTLWLFDVQWQYLGDYFQKPNSLRSVMHFVRILFKKILSVYSGQFEFVIHGQLLLVLSMTAAILIRLIRKKRSILDIIAVTAALVAILVLPFALDIATLNTTIPVRSMVSFPIIMTGLCILGWRALDDCPKIRLFAGLLIVFVSVQYAILINQKAYASKLRHEQDMAILQSIKDRCYQIPEFTAELKKIRKIPLAVVGNLSFPKYRNFPMWNYSMLNCMFEPAVVINLHLLGETYFYPASAAEMKRVFPAAISMPSWPDQGSVRYENGIMIVKLSEFNAIQCRQNGLPFRPATPDNSILRLKKLPSPVKPVWSLNSGTLDSVQECKAEFSGSKLTVKPFGWHSLRSKAVNADPKKMYYLNLLLQQNKRNGLIYLGFSDPDRYGDENIAEVDLSRGERQCILRVPGRYLAGPLSIQLGDLSGKEQVFEKFELLECAGPENLLAP